jgi:hypothetical protein
MTQMAVNFKNIQRMQDMAKSGTLLVKIITLRSVLEGGLNLRDTCVALRL